MPEIHITTSGDWLQLRLGPDPGSYSLTNLNVPHCVSATADLYTGHHRQGQPIWKYTYSPLPWQVLITDPRILTPIQQAAPHTWITQLRQATIQALNEADAIAEAVSHTVLLAAGAAYQAGAQDQTQQLHTALGI